MSILSVIGLLVLFHFGDGPTIGGVKPKDTWNFSRLDKITLAAFLD